MSVKLTPFEDASGLRITAVRDDRNASLIAPKRLEDSAVFGLAVKRLRETASGMAASASGQIADLSPEGWRKQFPTIIRPLVAPWQGLQGTAMDRQHEMGARRADLLTNGPAIPLGTADGEKLLITFAHATRSAQTVNWLADKKPSDLMAAALGNRELGSLILSNPSLREKLPGDLAERLETDVMEQTLADQFARQLPKVKPSYDSPLANAPDLGGAKTAARQAMASFVASDDEIAGVEMVLKSAVDFVAILGDVSRAEAFAMLNG